MQFLRKKLGVRDGESVFCYVNSVFAPGLDEGVGGLWRVSHFYVFGRVGLGSFRREVVCGERAESSIFES